MYRNTYEGGDGWTYYPMAVEISDDCPKCGQRRGTPEPQQFCEDGEWFTVDRWTNACGHVDTYKDVYQEANEINLQPTGKKAVHDATAYQRKKRKIEAGLNRLLDRFGLDDHDLQS